MNTDRKVGCPSKLLDTLFQEGADLLQKGEIGFQMYAHFRMGFIGWPNLLCEDLYLNWFSAVQEKRQLLDIDVIYL